MNCTVKGVCKKGKTPISYSVYYDVFKATGLRFKKPYTDICRTCDVFETKSRFLEALAGRGSDQVASVLYKHIHANIPGNIKKLTTFPDTCARQNRNIAVAIMFMCLDIHMLDVISDHARIDCAKKKMDVETVRGMKPFNVYEMKVNDFLSFSPLLQSLLVRRHVDNKNEKVSWLNIRWLQSTTDFDMINFKYSLSEEEHLPSA
ncbi:hypothetical protein PR048_032344 [Dryococelus australis]|uniref:Uncharacterized protein n=1 Tax=Dryococelus australis TaxID=614101 RepID=A0ABQ9G4T5_9NEOP|nr:hypothetical protein PR048_032344 [Dryococelus australis]